MKFNRLTTMLKSRAFRYIIKFTTSRAIMYCTISGALKKYATSRAVIKCSDSPALIKIIIY